MMVKIYPCIVLITFLILINGCVTIPRDISPTTVDEAQFSHMDCTELRSEQYQTQMKLIDLMEQQMELRRNQTYHPFWLTTANVVLSLSISDAVSAFWIIYPIVVNQFSHDSEIALLKGKLESLRLLAEKKGCTQRPTLNP